jgi:hypothetical protein
MIGAQALAVKTKVRRIKMHGYDVSRVMYFVTPK